MNPRAADPSVRRVFVRLIIGVAWVSSALAVAGERQCRPLRADGGVTCPEPWGVCRVVSGKDEWLARDDDVDSEPAKRVWVDTNGDGVAEASVERTSTATGRPLLERFDHNGNGLVDEELRHEYSDAGQLVVTKRWQRWPTNEVTPLRNRYDGGLLTEQLDANTWRSLVRYEYDGAGLLTRIVAPFADRRIERNDAGQVVSDVTSSEGRERTTVRARFGASGQLVFQETIDANWTPPRVIERVLPVGSDAGVLAAPGPRVRFVDGRGRIVERLEFEGGPTPVRYVSRFDRAGREIALERLQRYGDPQVWRFTRDTEGRVTEVVVTSGKQRLWTESYRYEGGRLVQAITPAGKMRAVYEDGLLRQRERPGEVVHYEYDSDQLARWKREAPRACDAADVIDALSPLPSPSSLPVVTSQTLVHPSFSSLPDGGLVDDQLGSQLFAAQNGLVEAAREAAVEAAGLEWAQPVERSNERDLLLVATSVQWCEAPRFVLDRKARTVAPLEARVVCGETRQITMEGSLAVGGCGVAPPITNWYVRVPKGTKLLEAPRRLDVTVPRCIEVHPRQGFSHPP